MLLFFSSTASRLGVDWRLGVDIAKRVDSYHRMSHSAINPQGDEKEDGTSVVMTFLCASNHYCAEALLPRKQLDICLLTGRGE